VAKKPVYNEACPEFRDWINYFVENRMECKDSKMIQNGVPSAVVLSG
jgi:hypothetical protein